MDYRGQVFINFRDYAFADRDAHGHRWVDIKRFGLRSPSADDATLLQALVRHEQFRDDYAGGGVVADGTRHGPYWLECVTPRSFEPIDAPATVDVLRMWADQYGDVPESLQASLDAEVFGRIRRATSRYRLKDLGRGAFHDWGGVHGDFHEFVLIDRTALGLSLVVAADD